MRKALTVFDRFRKDEDGAALIEYTVLLGIMWSLSSRPSASSAPGSVASGPP
jgi:hypothetical protein